MLINFKLKNNALFAQGVELSLIPTLERQHRQFVLKPNDGPSILSMIGIWGANGVGKTYLLSALTALSLPLSSGTSTSKNVNRANMWAQFTIYADEDIKKIELNFDENGVLIQENIDDLRMLDGWSANHLRYGDVDFFNFNLYNMRSGIHIIDDFGIKMHPLKLWYILGKFRDEIKDGSNRQLIFSTNSTHILDQALFRRDEMYLLDNKKGYSELYSIADFKDVRYDKDIRRSYLKGRFGGIPYLTY